MVTKAEWVKALQEERAGYLRAGKKDRVAAVEEELKKLGWSDPDVPKGRSSSEAHKSKADQQSKQEG